MGGRRGDERYSAMAADTVMPAPHVAYDAPTGFMLIGWRHMDAHGTVEDIEQFAAILMKAARERRALEEKPVRPGYLHVLEADGI